MGRREAEERQIGLLVVHEAVARPQVTSRCSHSPKRFWKSASQVTSWLGEAVVEVPQRLIVVGLEPHIGGLGEEGAGPASEDTSPFGRYRSHRRDQACPHRHRPAGSGRFRWAIIEAESALALEPVVIDVGTIRVERAALVESLRIATVIEVVGELAAWRGSRRCHASPNRIQPMRRRPGAGRSCSRRWITPLTAFAPHKVPPNPLTTGMRSTSASMTFLDHPRRRRRERGEMTVRPSIVPSSLLASTPSEPRALMAHWLGIDLGDVQGLRRQAQGLRQRQCARVRDVIPGDDLDGRGGIGQLPRDALATEVTLGCPPDLRDLEIPGSRRVTVGVGGGGRGSPAGHPLACTEQV